MDLYPRIFRVLNTAWAGAIALIFALELRDPSAGALSGLVFWLIYLLASIGTMFDLRVAWTLCITQLLAIWVLMGIVVSDQSFEFFTGRIVGQEDGRNINMMVFNSFFGILMPASVMIILLVLSSAHVRFILFSRSTVARRKSGRPRRA